MATPEVVSDCRVGFFRSVVFQTTTLEVGHTLYLFHIHRALCCSRIFLDLLGVVALQITGYM